MPRHLANTIWFYTNCLFIYMQLRMINYVYVLEASISLPGIQKELSERLAHLTCPIIYLHCKLSSIIETHKNEATIFKSFSLLFYFRDNFSTTQLQTDFEYRLSSLIQLSLSLLLPYNYHISMLFTKKTNHVIFPSLNNYPIIKFDTHQFGIK